jgi:hypothetical protein
VRGEDGGDADAGEEREGVGAGEPCLAEAAQGAAEAAALRWGGGVEQGGAAAALAVVGLGEIDELEVEGEGAGEEVGGVGVGGDVVREGLGFGEMLLRCHPRLRSETCHPTEQRTPVGDPAWGTRSCFGFAAGDGGAAEVFYGVEEGGAGLLAEDLAEQRAERADVAAERRFLEFAGAGF